MAPFFLLTAGVNLWTKSASVFSCSHALPRWTSLLPGAYGSSVKCLTSQTSGPPKRPLNSFVRYSVQQRPFVVRQNPELKQQDIARKIGEQWRILSPEQKQPFKEEFVKAMVQFKVDMEKYQARLSPDQIQQQALEKKQMIARRNARRKRQELNDLGKPKRPLSAFNVYMSEHFEHVHGATTREKMINVVGEWKRLLSHQKKVYIQLEEDDKIRYKNEMKSWEEQMVEIGREDLLRHKTQITKKKKRKAQQ